MKFLLGVLLFPFRLVILAVFFAAVLVVVAAVGVAVLLNAIEETVDRATERMLD